jgi:hypothetical protein
MRSPEPLDEGDDEMTFWRFNDLVERNIVSNRQDLMMKQKLYGFPKPVRLGAQSRHGAALFQRAAVKRWVEGFLNRPR